MGKRRRTPEAWRIKQYIVLIRQVRGRATLEALHRLQGGICAYDESPCALILPSALDLVPKFHMLKFAMQRFSTIDHVVPRALGGENEVGNFVMASQFSNCNKGSLAPLGQWVPRWRHRPATVIKTISQIEHSRRAEATRFASDRAMDRELAARILIEAQLNKIGLSSYRNFKFYDKEYKMVA